MKTPAVQALRRTLAADRPGFGLWVTLEAPAVTEMAVALGLDWVVIDAEHGHLDWKAIAEHVRATVRSETVALVRIAELNGGLVKRALDIGADGVVVPWVESAEQLTRAVSYARYPPEGVRGIGAERATAWGQALAEHAGTANEHVLVVPIIETVKGAAAVPDMCTVPGVDLFWFGPADFSASAGHRGQWEGPGVAEEILRLKDVLRRAGKSCGVMATGDADVRRRLDQGFRLIGLGADAGLLIRALRTSLRAVGRDRVMRADLDVPRKAGAASPSLGASGSASIGPRSRPFRVALTADFQDADGRPRYRDTGLGLFAGTRVEVRPLADYRPEIGADQLAGANGVFVLSPRVTAASLKDSTDLLAVARFGVGYDSVDVSACTAADVLLFIATGAVDRSVAEATVGWMLALGHHVRVKDKLVREARWDERGSHMGTELRDRTIGVIGFGGIGRELVRLLARFDMNPPLVYDPFVPAADVIAAGARPVSLDDLLAGADFVSIHCPLTDQTRNLIAARELGRMKPTAYLINTARGGIVDEPALEAALREGRIAGAALDCFAREPLIAPPGVAALDNVLLAPHCIAWTDELFRDIGRTVCRDMIDLTEGRVPRGVVNPEVLDRPTFQAKWQRLCDPPQE
ncbi:MAG TPA: aldolase/citrate lyase family protein [Gemmataceae bacterium]|nr:aldolase/citrate lyase family protein [Gemmataceae bacterium]